MPVIFLPNDDDQNDVDANCEDTGDAQMSSFALMSFAMAMVNAVINNANNVNNNNNNNNNNDNNNNNNLGNINIANSNNDVNNMNMVTAGRRRMLDKKEQRSNIKGVTDNPIEEKKPSLEEAHQKPYVHTISIGYLTKNHTDKATNNDIKVVPNIASKTRQNVIKNSRMEEGYSLKRIHEAFSIITNKIFKRIVYHLDKSPLKNMFNNFAYHFIQDD